MTASVIWVVGYCFTLGFIDKEMEKELGKGHWFITFATIIMWPVFLGRVCRGIVNAMTKEK